MQNHNPPFSPLIDSFLIQRKRQVRGRAAIIWKRASEMLHWTLLQETKRRFFSPFPPSDSFPVLLASITCAEANASTLGNNQSKEVTDGGGGTRLFFFFFSWLKAYLKSEECVRGTLQHLPAPFPLSEQRQASLQLLHTARFPEQFCPASAPRAHAALGPLPKGPLPSVPTYPPRIAPCFLISAKPPSMRSPNFISNPPTPPAPSLCSPSPPLTHS